MEVLTAYVRQHAHWSGYEAEKNAEEASRAGFQITEGPAPTPDIQAIVTVLWRRTRSQAQGEPEPLNLFQTNLRGANLTGANLTGASFTSTYLVEANFSGAHRRRADLGSTNLQAAQFEGADLREAYLDWDVMTDEQAEGD
jgi:uncharacterized protein YjbI with pentapeptide repeats